MRSDVHSAALKAAAKVAFSVALLNGCSGADLDDDAASSESAYANGKAGKRLKKKPCPSEADAAPAKPTCEQVLASTFPTPNPDAYQWEGVAQPADVVSCCDAELTKNGAGSTYIWDCCVAYDPTVDAGRVELTHGMACTPWGPPVPPSMKRVTRRRNPAMAAWIASSQMKAAA